MTALASTPMRRPSAVREFGAAVSTIMVKELRSRMRGRRAFIVLTVYLGLLALIAYGVYTVSAPIVAQFGMGFGPVGPGVPNASAQIGQAIFTWLSIFQLILVLFIAPAFTAGQISLEREKQTLDLLISTPLRPGAIVVGKLLAALAFVVLMILASIPISAIVLMYGGASLDDLVRQQIVLLATAFGCGSIGLFYSALLKRTQAATVLTYCTMLALTMGTAMLFIFWTVLLVRDAGFGQFATQRAPEQLMYLNPGVAMADVIAQTEAGGFGAFTSMLAQMRGEDIFGAGGGVVCQGDVCFPDDGRGQFDVGVVGDVGDVSLLSGYWWQRFSLTFVGAAVLLTLVSMRLVVPAGMRFAFRRRNRARGLAVQPAAAGGALAGDGVAGSSIEELPEADR